MLNKYKYLIFFIGIFLTLFGYFFQKKPLYFNQKYYRYYNGVYFENNDKKYKIPDNCSIRGSNNEKTSFACTNEARDDLFSVTAFSVSEDKYPSFNEECFIDGVQYKCANYLGVNAYLIKSEGVGLISVDGVFIGLFLKIISEGSNLN